ncbi:3-hydroxy-3-methylglutaryl-CoA lyase [Candidatus Formimonas warabiya]|uniref:Pyruvate carboxyltransferase domain-containing protein n=1 Tax=Formimonas warabiya TaxID=1761012 RepID=A0A3G1KQL8_FORW1|nr:3-hydroxy-3-methylglutaryl-CoA lyase [Candidatus Formimonas warabiya]ATW24748.1 hypothetical protein DCMF_08140 [Candidatus Formimonas warabiya]
MHQRWMSDDFWVSPFNYEPGVINRPNMPQQILIHDTTLRDGEQTPGVVFRLAEKMEIAKALDGIGVDRIEAGMPMVSPEDAETITAIAGLGLKAEISCVTRAVKADIDLAAACGVKRVVVEMPTSVPRLKYQYAKWTEEEAIENTVTGLAYAKEKGLKVTLFMMDTGRAEKTFLEKLLVSVTQQSPPDAVTVVDTSGCLIPAATANLVRFIKEHVPCPIEIHTHNDMGLGLANTLAAVEAGAEVVHVCVNGLGERSGNVSLDEVVMSLLCLYGFKTSVDHRRLTEISGLVARLSNIPVHRNKPIVGNGIFCRESGLGIDLIEKTPLAIYSLVPSAVGQKPSIVLGKKSGIASIHTTVQRLGITGLSEEQMRAVLNQVKALGISKKGLVTDAEFLKIVTEVRQGHTMNL